MSRMKLGVLVSGRGSNLQALLDAATDPTWPAEVALVLSNQPGVQALDRAAAAGVPAAVIDHRDVAARAAFEAALDAALRDAGVELVCLAGFMRVLSADFVARWFNRLVNIHPSLLPAFPGLDTHARAIKAGVRWSGCTVHLVRATVDQGPILIQAAVPVLPEDRPEDLAARVLTAEHRCYPRAVAWLASGRWTVVGDTVRLADPAPVSRRVHLNPVG